MYTQGKWKMTGIGNVRITTNNGDMVEYNVFNKTNAKIGELRANARLIAAAPELLEACKIALGNFKLAEKMFDIAAPKTVAALENAIAQAESE